MHILKFFLSLFFCSAIAPAFGQTHNYSAANAHSHNDYRQQNPFLQAYNEQFGSIEADVHLTGGLLLVGHDSVEIKERRTLEDLYLFPLSKFIENNKGRVYPDSSLKLQLLIDLKTEAVTTLDALVALLKKFPSVIYNPAIRIIITGNLPDETLFNAYPAYIWFDGNPDRDYSKSALPRIALLSGNFGKYSHWKGVGPLPVSDSSILTAIVNKAHSLNKPLRFWANPDFDEAWKTLVSLKVDYINTDQIAALSDFLKSRDKTLRLMPYNRIIRSAGDVIRFGDPKLENHALDAAILADDSKLVIEDRYGIMALDAGNKKIIGRWNFSDIPRYRKYMSTYSGIRSFMEKGKTWIVWSAAERDGGNAVLMIAEWADGFRNFSDIPIEKKASARNAIPNEIEVSSENGELFLYVVLNGNNELLKIRWNDRSILWRSATGVAPYGVAMANGSIYVSNWAGSNATDSSKERAGVPWGLAYTDPQTGATSSGTVIVFDPATGKTIRQINVGLHPNAVKASKDGRYIYVSNGSSDAITVINTKSNTISESVDVGLLKGKYNLQGSTPNALELNADNTILYVANGFDNAVAVVRLGKNASANGKGKSFVNGYIPTEAYPGGLKLVKDLLVVTNLESDGANVTDQDRKAGSIHQQLASVSIIPIPGKVTLERYTQEVAQLNLLNRREQLLLLPRAGVVPVPVPERLGEPSVFKHVVYIIKENKTYDQVFGDIPQGKGDSSLCIFGEKITPNMHALAKQFGWMDDYYASGKSSAEGHQWTDAGMVSDYVAKNVRAWFRSYPHRQDDALVYNKSGFIWNQALDNGKTVRIYGEACETEYDRNLKWADLYKRYKDGKKPDWHNESTIARILPIISPTFPDCDNIAFSDQQRADIFIQEWKQFEKGDSLPNLMILSLPNDHSAGTSPDFPTPNAMVADNDLAVGRIIEMISKSRYWDSTVIFITQDDSQSGWDHISAYRTIGLTVSPYSSGKLVSSNYNQTSMLRTIEQILGLPPMNVIDASARLMTDCFQNKINPLTYTALPNNVPLDQMNKGLQGLRGKARKFALQSKLEVFNEVDGGEDDIMNRIIWFYAKGETKYPRINSGQK
ncbi:MAG: beta-propeller fold lactonase family protein [Ferruginibacter sp.]|nr:beta-propeller fold lactonase family protein [Ferruginibacter sp.]